MKKRILPLALVALFAAPAALSHVGVKDPQVMARMQVMSLVAADMKILGGMVKGSIAFDQDRLQARAASLEQHALDTLRLFEPQAVDPKSEAKPEIWDNWDDFSKKTANMQNAAKKLGLVGSEAALTPAFRELGQTCTACHQSYRIKSN